MAVRELFPVVWFDKDPPIVTKLDEVPEPTPEDIEALEAEAELADAAKDILATSTDEGELAGPSEANVMEGKVQRGPAKE